MCAPCTLNTHLWSLHLILSNKSHFSNVYFPKLEMMDEQQSSDIMKTVYEQCDIFCHLFYRLTAVTFKMYFCSWLLQFSFPFVPPHAIPLRWHTDCLVLDLPAPISSSLQWCRNYCGVNVYTLTVSSLVDTCSCWTSSERSHHSEVYYSPQMKRNMTVLKTWWALIISSIQICFGPKCYCLHYLNIYSYVLEMDLLSFQKVAILCVLCLWLHHCFFSDASLSCNPKCPFLWPFCSTSQLTL